MSSTHRAGRWLTLVAPPLILLSFFLWTSFEGLDFGRHWDETRAKFDSIRNTLRTGIFLQASADGSQYNHGGLNYLLAWTGLAPELLQYFREGQLTREALAKAINPVLYSLPVRLRVRAIYVVLC